MSMSLQEQTTAFDDNFRHVASPSFILNLHILTALLFLSLLVSVASLVLRYRAGGFWFVGPPHAGRS